MLDPTKSWGVSALGLEGFRVFSKLLGCGCNCFVGFGSVGSLSLQGFSVSGAAVACEGLRVRHFGVEGVGVPNPCGWTHFFLFLSGARENGCACF